MPKDTKEVESKIIQILSDKLDIDAEKIKPESRLFEDLGMDSFAAVEMAYELKIKFKIDIPPKNLPTFKTVKDIVVYAFRHLQK